MSKKHKKENIKYTRCDNCKYLFYPLVKETEEYMYFECPKCNQHYLVLDKNKQRLTKYADQVQ